MNRRTLSMSVAVLPLLTPLLTPLLATPLAARPASDPPPAESDDIVVTGIFARDPRDSASPVSVLAGEALDRALRPQIGEAPRTDATFSYSRCRSRWKGPSPSSPRTCSGVHQSANAVHRGSRRNDRHTVDPGTGPG